MKTNLSKLIGAWKNLNIIVLVTLMDILTPADGESLIRRLQEILKVQIVDLSPLYIIAFGAEPSEAINIHFEAVGYESSDFLINSG